MACATVLGVLSTLVCPPPLHALQARAQFGRIQMAFEAHSPMRAQKSHSGSVFVHEPVAAAAAGRVAAAEESD